MVGDERLNGTFPAIGQKPFSACRLEKFSATTTTTTTTIDVVQARQYFRTTLQCYILTCVKCVNSQYVRSDQWRFYTFVSGVAQGVA